MSDALKSSLYRLLLGEPDGFVEVSENIRIYYRDKGKIFDDGTKDGFEFSTIEEFNYKTSYFRVLYHGEARSYGLRKFFLYSEHEGVGDACHPDVEIHIKILQEIRKLELKYCDGEDNR